MLGGAALVMTASVNSFAGTSSNSEGKNKTDLSKLKNIDAFKNLEVKDESDVAKKVKDLPIDGKQNEKGDSIKVDDFKKDSFSVVLTIKCKDGLKGKVDNAYKVETEEKGEKLKLTAVSDKTKLEPSTYIISTWDDSGAKIKFEMKKFDKKQKLDGEKAYKDDDSK